MPTDSKNTKKSFLLYNSFWEALHNLTDEKLGRLTRAIFEREVYGTPIDLSSDPELAMAYSFMRIQLDINEKKWEETRKKRIKAGEESGKVRREKSNQKKRVNPSNNTEQNELLFNSQNNGEHNEHMFDLLNKTNKDELNVNVDGYVDGYVNVNGGDDGDDIHDKADASSNSINTSSSSYDYWDFYPVFFFLGYSNPVQVTKEFVGYYEDQNWTLRGGRKLLTLNAKINKAKKWVPKNPSMKTARTDMDFLATWESIWKTMKKENAPVDILRAALDERIRVDYNDSAHEMTISLTREVGNYLEARPNLLDLLAKLRIEKGMKVLQYRFLTKASMAKYTF